MAGYRAVKGVEGAAEGHHVALDVSAVQDFSAQRVIADEGLRHEVVLLPQWGRM